MTEIMKVICNYRGLHILPISADSVSEKKSFMKLVGIQVVYSCSCFNGQQNKTQKKLDTIRIQNENKHAIQIIHGHITWQLAHISGTELGNKHSSYIWVMMVP
jgi:hypothetical protein